MRGFGIQFWRQIRLVIRHATNGPQALAFIPALILGGYWLVGEGAMIFLALGIPTGFALGGLVAGAFRPTRAEKDIETGLALRDTAAASLNQCLANEPGTGETAAAIVIGLDDFRSVQEAVGAEKAATVLRLVAERIACAIRGDDVLVRLGPERFGIAIGPMRRADLETLISICGRLQSGIADPCPIDATRVFVTASVGFCLPGRAPSRTGEALLDCAELALEEALREGPSAIRAYSPDLMKRASERRQLSGELEDALLNGLIEPWFQPQLSTDTGKIIAISSSPRWAHPEKGSLPARQFLHDIHEQGLGRQLDELIFSKSCAWLKVWRESGLDIPAVGVALGPDRIADSRLVEHLAWELDRHDLSPRDIRLEITEETVQSDETGDIAAALFGLTEFGLDLELVGFGRGNASIGAIRRHSIRRIRIDRSYVTRVDRDHEQQTMISAILTMAAKLAITTVADGVDTAGEHAVLAQLGCDAVQGLAVAPPMQGSEIPDWIRRHDKKFADLRDLAARQAR